MSNTPQFTAATNLTQAANPTVLNPVTQLNGVLAGLNSLKQQLTDLGIAQGLDGSATPTSTASLSTAQGTLATQITNLTTALGTTQALQTAAAQMQTNLATSTAQVASLQAAAATAASGAATATAPAPGATTTTTTTATTAPPPPVISTTMLVGGLLALAALGGGLWWLTNQKHKKAAGATEADEEDDEEDDEEPAPKKYPLPRMATPTRANKGPHALLPKAVRSRARANPRMLPPGTLPQRRSRRRAK